MQYEMAFEIWIDDSSPSSTQQITFALHRIWKKKKKGGILRYLLNFLLKKGRGKKNMSKSKGQFPIARFFFFFRGQIIWSNYFSLLQTFVFLVVFLSQCSVDILTETLCHYNILPKDYLSRIWPSFDQTIQKCGLWHIFQVWPSNILQIGHLLPYRMDCWSRHPRPSAWKAGESRARRGHEHTWVSL